MSNFSYEEYAAKQAAMRAANPQGGAGNFANGVEVHYVNEFLKNDGDTIVVRFPYHSIKDLTFESTHAINVTGRKFPMRVRCEGDGCEICAAGTKVDMRFCAKCLVYVVDDATGGIKLLNAVWDRPAIFADTQMKTLFQEYGDISNQLFKIRRSGSGMQTRYTVTIVLNSAVYNPDIYKADFTELNTIDPAKICIRSLDKLKADREKQQSDETEDEPVVSVPAGAATYNQPVQQPVYQQPVYQQPVQQTPAYTAPQQPAYSQPTQTNAYNYQQPAQTAGADASTERVQKRYTF